MTPRTQDPAATEASTVVSALLATLPGRVRTAAAVLEPYRRDRSGRVSGGPPLAVVEALSVADVQEACRIASAHGVPIVTRGAGTGLAGGGIAGPDEIVLSTRAMDRVLRVSPQNRLAVVEPGILNAELNDRLAEHGLWWAPDPASREISTVGGNIATNAGGLLCAKYGVTRESVLSLKVVLADGRLIQVGHDTVKGVTGLDLCALMIGSEGTLGVIVECTLRLRPLVSGPIATIGAFFPSVERAAAAAGDVVAAGWTPAVMELMDRRTLECVGRYTGQDLLARGDALLLVQVDGAGALTEADAVHDLVVAAGGAAELTTDAAESSRWMDLRRQAFPAIESLGTLLVEDVAVPLDRMSDMFAHVRRLEGRYGVIIPTACHAGDGNLHPTFAFQGEEVPAEVWQAAGEVFEHALALGGTLSGEHGIGLLKRRWLGDELGEDQLDLQRQIKAVFDPAGLLNPGKVFPDDDRSGEHALS
ncbi:FAD-binding oxidoreductase [Georgenia ruanii]|uniref:FAD-binding protein n=1 Tax=Georgenia ruanii TaxID=348442 RepID=A0A7J9UY51_9MICO|nr:FAD-linked oxidase C-terminal domain-containing protein [Georgenia ruanii]MPV89559.1 FAD-binding protein [Georgenia ruanii]